VVSARDGSTSGKTNDGAKGGAAGWRVMGAHSFRVLM
jgi:hypothetical protein